MADALTPEELDAIEQRANAATDGPWLWAERHWYEGYENDPSGAIGNEAGERVVAHMNYHCCDFPDTPTISEPDTAFIAAARSDVPALVESLRAAWEERDALRTALARFADERGPNGNPRCEGNWGTGYICGVDSDGQEIRGFTDWCRYCTARAALSEYESQAGEK